MSAYIQDVPGFFSGLMVVLFGIIGGFGQLDQAWKIWTKDDKSVSLIWTMTFTVMFAGFIVQGLATKDYVMQFQGIIRCMLYVPIIAGMGISGYRMRKSEALLYLVLGSVLLMMILHDEWRSVLFQALGYTGVAMTCHQPYLIFRNKKRGSVSIGMITTYNLSVICWMVYALWFGNMSLFFLFAAFCAVYTATMILWVKYP